MPFFLSPASARWLKGAMSRERGAGSRPRRTAAAPARAPGLFEVRTRTVEDAETGKRVERVEIYLGRNKAAGAVRVNGSAVPCDDYKLEPVEEGSPWYVAGDYAEAGVNARHFRAWLIFDLAEDPDAADGVTGAANPGQGVIRWGITLTRPSAEPTWPANAPRVGTLRRAYHYFRPIPLAFRDSRDYGVEIHHVGSVDISVEMPDAASLVKDADENAVQSLEYAPDAEASGGALSLYGFSGGQVVAPAVALDLDRADLLVRIDDGDGHLRLSYVPLSDFVQYLAENGRDLLGLKVGAIKDGDGVNRDVIVPA